jgi:hypothetical protein
MTQPPPELREFLHRYAPAIQSLTLGLRTVVLEELAPCHEYIFEMRSKVVLLYGATEHVIKDGICYIAPFSKHVNLGFHRGAHLNNRARRLEGTGKAMRHIKLKKLSELDRPDLRGYLRQARKQAGLNRPRHRADGDVVTRVKPRRASF